MLTTRGVLEASILSIIRLVKRKCPRWFVASWLSYPSGESAKLVAIMPALFTRTSICDTSAHELISAAHLRTAASEPRSSWSRRTWICGSVFVIASAVRCSFVVSRPANIKKAGCALAMVSTKVAPRLVGDTPVVRMHLPLMCWLKSSTTSLAVVVAWYDFAIMLSGGKMG